MGRAPVICSNSCCLQNGLRFSCLRHQWEWYSMRLFVLYFSLATRELKALFKLCLRGDKKFAPTRKAKTGKSNNLRIWVVNILFRYQLCQPLTIFKPSVDSEELWVCTEETTVQIMTSKKTRQGCGWTSNKNSRILEWLYAKQFKS